MAGEGDAGFNGDCCVGVGGDVADGRHSRGGDLTEQFSGGSPVG